MESVLHVGSRIRNAPKFFTIRFVLGEQRRRLSFEVKETAPQIGMLQNQIPLPRANRSRLLFSLPAPGVAEPKLRDGMQFRRLIRSVANRQPNEHIFRRRLRVLDKEIEVAIPIEDAGVDQLELSVARASFPVFLSQTFVGVSLLRIFVEGLHVGMGRRRIEVVVILFDVLSVIALSIGQPEEALFQNRIVFIPKGKAEADSLMIVGDPEDPILSPPVGSFRRIVERKVMPRVPVGAVILPHRAPLPLRQIRPPPPPPRLLLPRFLQSLLLFVHPPPYTLSTHFLHLHVVVDRVDVVDVFEPFDEGDVAVGVLVRNLDPGLGHHRQLRLFALDPGFLDGLFHLCVAFH